MGWRKWQSFSEALWLKAVVGEFILWHHPALGLNWLCGGWCQAAPAGLEAQGPWAAKIYPLLGGRLRDSYVPKLCMTVPGLHFFLWQLSSNFPGFTYPCCASFPSHSLGSACSGPSTRLLGECLQTGAAETVPTLPLGQTTMRTIPLGTCTDSACFLLS